MAGWLLCSSANAVPQFSREYNRDCSSCHNAWPALNRTGREFKENGYRLADEVGEDVEFLAFPASGILVARPYDKKDSQSDARLRALHEAELIVGGAFGDRFSGLMAIEYEDEIDDDSFGQVLEFAQLSYHASRQFNLHAVWGQAFAPDPYGVITDHLRLTRGHAANVDQGFGGTDGRIRSTRQSFSASGRLTDSFFYNVGVSGEAEDALGVAASNAHVRGAYDLTENFMLGAFVIDGSASSSNRGYSRLGIDAMADIGNSRVSAAFVSGDDEVCGMVNCAGVAVTEDNNHALSVQWYHTIPGIGNGPGIVPLVRVDHYDQADGTQEFSELTLNLGFYFRENAKVYLEYWDRFKAPSGSEDNRITLQAYVGF